MVKNQRNSSVELFRIIATFLVLIVHFNGWFVPIHKHFQGWESEYIGQSIIESFSIICVNSFLVITGWYGVNFKWKHILNIYFVISWIYVLFYLFQVAVTHEFSIISLLFDILAIGKESYYIQCYMLLLIISPILNSYIKEYGKTAVKQTLILWGVEFILDFCLNNNCLGFGHGFQFMHFVLMYLLGRMAYIYRLDLFRLLTPKRCLILTGCSAFLIWFGYIFINSRVFAYSNPINIIMSFALFFVFAQKEFYNKTINWISASTLSVYVVHVTSPLIDYLSWLDNDLLIRVFSLMFLKTSFQNTGFYIKTRA